MVSQAAISQINGNCTSNSVFEEKLQDSIEILKRTFRIYKDNEIFLSFNGGKDCTVLLDMITKLNTTKNLKVVYIQPDNSFPEIEEFVDACEHEYGITLDRRKGKVKTVIETVCNEYPYKCCLMGNRRTDPHCSNLRAFQETDHGWPKLMRVNPLIDWTYHEVWEYLLKNNVNYCSLYNEGYTSIGDMLNTLRNPRLQLLDPNSGNITYQHAKELDDDTLERAGRKI